jgi:hypothetical protein
MRALACFVKYRCYADFARQPSGRVVGRFFPKHSSASVDRFPVLAQNHRQRRLWDDLIYRFACYFFQAQSSTHISGSLSAMPLVGVPTDDDEGPVEFGQNGSAILPNLIERVGVRRLTERWANN